MDQSREIEAICNNCKTVMFTYPTPYKIQYKTEDFNCLKCYIKNKDNIIKSNKRQKRGVIG